MCLRTLVTQFHHAPSSSWWKLLNDDFIWKKKLHLSINHCSLFTGYYSLLKKFQATHEGLEAKQCARLVFEEQKAVTTHWFIPPKNKTLWNLGHKPLVTNTKQLTDGVGSLQTKQRLKSHSPKWSGKNLLKTGCLWVVCKEKRDLN